MTIGQTAPRSLFLPVPGSMGPMPSNPMRTDRVELSPAATQPHVSTEHLVASVSRAAQNAAMMGYGAFPTMYPWGM